MEKINILVADDEIESCHFIRKGLLKQGYNVDISYDGREALERMRTNAYDFVFLDFSMPELNGVEVTEIIRQRGINCVIVMMTGYHIVDELFPKMLRVDEYLEKPFSLERVKEIISKYIKKVKKDEGQTI